MKKGVVMDIHQHSDVLTDSYYLSDRARNPTNFTDKTWPIVFFRTFLSGRESKRIRKSENKTKTENLGMTLTSLKVMRLRAFKVKTTFSYLTDGYIDVTAVWKFTRARLEFFKSQKDKRHDCQPEKTVLSLTQNTIGNFARQFLAC